MPRLPKINEGWLTLIVLAIGIPIAVAVGIVTFNFATSTTLHPNPEDVTSVMLSTPKSRWADAVERSRQFARQGLIDGNLPGLSVAVGVGQDITWAEGFGFANLADRTPVTPRMQFRIGHASKALTSAAVGLLLDQGRLKLDDEIQTYVPAFPKKPWPITLRQLMGHVSGVRHYRGEQADTLAAHCERASDALPGFARDPLLFEPETQYRYSTYGWVVVSAAIEAVASEPFFRFMRTKVFAPLGLSETTSDSTGDPSLERVTFYTRDFMRRVVPASVDASCFAGASAFLSTPSDLVRFGMAVSKGGFLKPDTVRMLQTPQLLASGKETEYGLGWMLHTVPLAGKSTRLASHASRTPVGGSTSLLVFPDRAIVVAVTSNKRLSDTRSIALRIAEAFARANEKE